MITVTWDIPGKCFVCRCAYSETAIVKKAGFRWEAKMRSWWSRDPDVARKLQTHWDDSVKRVFEVIERRRKEQEASRAVDANIEIPAPAGLNYLGYQRAGVQFSAKRANVLNADQMGLGKTIQAIGTINLLDKDINRVLVVCPATLKDNWRREMQKWFVRRRRIGIAQGSFWPFTDVVIINYDILQRHHDVLRAQPWDMLIADECHLVKNAKSIRSRYLLGGLEPGRNAIVDGKPVKVPGRRIKPIPAARKMFLSGTPICNRPIELYPIIHALDPERWSNWRDYAYRYCSAHNNGFGMDSSGGSRLDELQRILRATIMLRRLKDDVLTDLPPKMRQVIEFPATTPEMRRLVANEAALWKKSEAKLRGIQEEIARAQVAKDDKAYRAAVAKLSGGFSADFNEMSRIRRDTAVAKLPIVLEHLAECLESGNKVVVFAHHKEVIQRIYEKFSREHGAVLLYGETAMDKRSEAVRRFQEDARCRLFIGGIIPAGVGITLTASSHVCFAELDWVPGNITQAEDRCHRIGQRDSVMVQHLVLAGSIDAYMAKLVVDKQAMIEKALDITTDVVPKALPVPKPAVPDQPASIVVPRPPSLITAFDSTQGEQQNLF